MSRYSTGSLEGGCLSVVELQVLGQGLGGGLLLLGNNNNNKKKKKKNPHLNFLKGTVLGDKEQGVGIRDKGQGSKDKG